ncbi:MAG: tetratricopeptide repeat protein [Candidatus Thermoplasmatota archaeon]
MSRRLLTNRERILFLLSQQEFDPEEDYLAPYHLSQDGIAEALDMRKNNVSRELSGLKEKGLVEEKKARVKGFDRRRKVYLLSRKGKESRNNLLKDLQKKGLKIEDTKGEKHDATIEEAVKRLREEGKEVKTFHVAEWMRKKDVLNIEAFSVPSRLYEVHGKEKKDKKESTEVLIHTPKRKEIYGREEEIRKLKEKLGEKEPPFIVIEGIAGIGKTALGRKLLEVLRGERDLFWYSFKKWEDASNLYDELKGFLERSTGRKLDPRASLGQIAKTVVNGLKDSRAVLFLDDCEKMPKELRPFLEMMLREKKRGTDISMVLMTREELGFYDVRDEMEEHIFRLKLDPLEKENVKEMVSIENKKNSTIDVDEIYEKTKGHPLYLELFERYPGEESKMKDFLEREIYSDLSKDGKRLLQRLSIFWGPVKREVLLDKGDPEVLMDLKKNHLVKENENREIATHEILKDFFYENTALEERRELHDFAAERLIERGDKKDHRQIEIFYHLGKAGKAEKALNMMEDLIQEISGLPEKFRGKILDCFPENELTKKQKGRYYSLMGDIYSESEDWEKAVNFYNEAIERAGDTERLREKLGDAQMELQRWDETIETHKRNLARYKEKDDLEGEFREYLSLGTVYRKRKKFEKAEEFYEKAGSLIENLSDVNRAEAILYNNLGMLYFSKKDYSESEKMFKKALDKEGEKSIIHENLSSLYREMREMDRSLDHLNKAIEAHKRSEDQRDVIELLIKRADHFLKSEDLEAAVEDLQEALELEKKRTSKFWILGGKQPSKLKSRIYKKMAEAYREKGDMERCISNDLKAMEEYEGLDDKEKWTREGLVYSFDLVDAGKLKKALRVLDEVESELKTLGNQEGITAARLERARILKRKGEYRKAKKTLEKLIENAEKRGDERAVEEGEKILQKISKKTGGV